ncbi:MAG: UTP--glucose-1-phosphate uridylyltransferase [Clostridia bacterium]|nr:UTP--glucose-1-phosphate uridylyltransferase [Clostridia bacterium]
MKIRKAVIPAGGLGTRVLPASKSVPKEMLNVVDKPVIQYLVEEAVAAGIEDILIITNRGKGVIEDHFDHSYELEDKLKNDPSKESLYKSIKDIADLANITFIRQKETKGLGHAILRAKTFVGNDPFAVLYGDDLIFSDDPVTGQLCRAYEKFGCGSVAVKEVAREWVMKYCTLDVTPLEGNIMRCHKIIEKPAADQIITNFAILGRVVLPPDVFELLENSPYDERTGELYLTDAMSALAQRGELTAVDFVGKRYDMGAKLGIMQANVEAALDHPEIGEQFRSYIKELAKTL